MTFAGRNGPFWDCHPAEDAARHKAARRLHALGKKAEKRLFRFMIERFGAGIEGLVGSYPIAFAPGSRVRKAHLQLYVPWCLYEHRLKGHTAAEWFLKEGGEELEEEIRDWIETGTRARVSVWEVASVEPGRALGLEDLLTGERRRVVEATASKVLTPRLAILARVIDHPTACVLGGFHPASLPPTSAADAVHQMRTALRRKHGKVPASVLKTLGWVPLIAIWDAAVEVLNERPAPRLQNTDGDPLEPTTDHFVPASAAALRQIVARLKVAPDVDTQHLKDGESVHVFLRKGNKLHKSWENTVLGRVFAAPGRVRTETNSVNRADGLRGRLEALCGGLIRWDRRETEAAVSPWDKASAEREPDDAPEPAGRETRVVLREMKQSCYATWCDEPLPALGGKTPREAVKSRRLRAELDTILKEIELTESRQPEDARFDVRELRSELGM